MKKITVLLLSVMIAANIYAWGAGGTNSFNPGGDGGRGTETSYDWGAGGTNSFNPGDDGDDLKVLEWGAGGTNSMQP